MAFTGVEGAIEGAIESAIGRAFGGGVIWAGCVWDVVHVQESEGTVWGTRSMLGTVAAG